MKRLSLFTILLVLCLCSCGDRNTGLTVYCAHDAVYSQEILNAFSAETGIAVTAVFDTEATKSLGLIERIRREKTSPQCDVFWNNELLGTVQLQQEGLLQPYQGTGYARMPAHAKEPAGHWVGFGARMRVVMVNTERSSHTAASTLDGDLSQFAMAKPLYGTTLTHYAALWRELGAELPALHADRLARELNILNGNGAVKQAVAIGAVEWGWSDTDDYFLAVDSGMPVTAFPARLPSGKTIAIPNTVAIIAGTAHSAEARQLVNYLLSQKTELALANGRSRQIPLGPVPADALPEALRPWQAWAQEAVSLEDLSDARARCIAWLKAAPQK